MKKYDELTSEQKERALIKATSRLLSDIIEGSIRFNDETNGDNLQARIDAAILKAEKMYTPWFAHEYIMETCKSEIEGMAQCDAEDSLYSEPDEIVISGIII